MPGRLHAGWVALARGTLAASAGFVLLRFALTPVRMRVLTGLLSPGDYGLVTLFSMTAFGAATILSLGGFELLLRHLPGAEPEARRGFFRGVWLVTSAAGLAAAVLTLAGVLPRAWIGGQAGLSRPALALLLLGFLHMQQRTYFLLGSREHLRARATQLLWSELWFLPLLAGAPAGGWDAERAAWAWCGWMLAVSLATWRWVPLGRVWAAREGRQPARRWLALGLPMLPAALGEWTFRLVGHYVLLARAGATVMAFYALALNVAMVGYVAGVPLIDGCVTEFNRVHARGSGTRRELRRIVSRGARGVLAVAIPVALALVWLRAPLLRLLADPAFAAAADLLPWAAAVPLLLLGNLLLARLLVALGRAAVVGWGSLAGAALALTFCLLWVPGHGARGALVAIQCALALVDLYFGWRARLPGWLDLRELGPLRLAGGGVLLAGVYAAAGAAPWSAPSQLALAGGATFGVLAVLRWIRPGDFTARAG